MQSQAITRLHDALALAASYAAAVPQPIPPELVASFQATCDDIITTLTAS
jgi:hypothetical protein